MELERLWLALQSPRHLSTASAWVEHIPFAFVLVDLLRPRSVVELGTHMGDSYCAFCQAVDRLGLETRCTAIDTWTGDAQAGDYGQAILQNLRAYHDPLYGRFSMLLQSRFDDAADRFAPDSIDLLHIDGLHTYDAVRHDFETWLPKVSRERGIVLFHDTAVKKGDFGVHRLWAELSSRYRSFEFFHGYGLGVLATGTSMSPAMQALFDFAACLPDLVRSFFATLGSRIQLARGINRLVDLTDSQAPVLAEMLAPFEPVAPSAISDPIELLAPGAHDLKEWLDRRCEAAASRNTLTQHLHEHVRWLAGQKDALVARIAQLEAPPPEATLALYTPDEGERFQPDRAQTVRIVPDGAFHQVHLRIALPPAAPAPQTPDSVRMPLRRVRLDPGDRAAYWCLRHARLSWQVQGGHNVTVSLSHEQIATGPGVLPLATAIQASPAKDIAPQAPPNGARNLDTPHGGDYVFLSFTDDPQIELHLGDLLPPGQLTCELSLECCVIDGFGAYRGETGNELLKRLPAMLAGLPRRGTTFSQVAES